MNKYQYVCENYKKPKPILFNTEMVRAILDGRKTQTRRPIDVDISNNLDIDKDGSIYGYQCPETGDIYNLSEIINNIAPYQPGDILYVRETFSIDKEGDYVYRTNYGTTEDDSFPPTMFKWKPSIHMPKEAARIFLRVTDVRVERLQDITEEDARAEGVIAEAHDDFSHTYPSHKHAFHKLWNSINLTRGYGWCSNPWVWVIEFERVREMNTIDSSDLRDGFITRKLVVKENVPDDEIRKMEQQLIDWGIHLASRFDGDDNYFVVGFENELDLLAFHLAGLGVELKEIN